EPRYRQLGARVIRTVPNTGVAVDVDWAHLKERYDVAFLGSIRTADRRWYLNEFRTNSMSVDVFGEGSGGYVSFKQMLDIYKTSRINLNFSKTGAHPWARQLKGRVFQVCLAGGFLLTEYAPGIENYFELGKQIICFDSPREMVDKARYYLNHEAERSYRTGGMGASKRGILVKLHGRESVRRDCGGLDQRSKERQPRCRVEADHQRPQSACDVPSGVGQSADSGK